jgi:hypothetical protein
LKLFTPCSDLTSKLVYDRGCRDLLMHRQKVANYIRKFP